VRQLVIKVLSFEINLSVHMIDRMTSGRVMVL